MLNARLNILFEDKMLQNLTNLARTKNTSMGELVRSAVTKTFFNDVEEIEVSKRAVEETFKIRPKIKGKIDYKALINEGRKW